MAPASKRKGPASLLRSSMATVRPLASRTGAAAQCSEARQRKKCSPPRTWQTSPVRTATPGAPVPTASSAMFTPTRAAVSSSGPSPGVGREAISTTPSLQVSMARAWLPAITVSSSAMGSRAASISARLWVSKVAVRILLTGSKLIFSSGLRLAPRQRVQDCSTGSDTRPEGRSPRSK